MEIRDLQGLQGLDNSYGSMASKTAEGFYKTLINGTDYLVQYFRYSLFTISIGQIVNLKSCQA